jgi:predicted Zn-dependent peptidase
MTQFQIFFHMLAAQHPCNHLKSMLAARARIVQRLARNFATVADTTGVKVAAFDNNQPTSSVTLFVKAGSRFESKAGVANALKNFAFKVCSCCLI